MVGLKLLNLIERSSSEESRQDNATKINDVAFSQKELRLERIVSRTTPHEERLEEVAIMNADVVVYSGPPSQDNGMIYPTFQIGKCSSNPRKMFKVKRRMLNGGNS